MHPGPGESLDGRRRQRQRDHAGEDGHPQWMCPVCLRKQWRWRTFCRRCLLFAPGVQPGPGGSLGFGPAWEGASSAASRAGGGSTGGGSTGGGLAGPTSEALRQGGGARDDPAAFGGARLGIRDPVEEEPVSAGPAGRLGNSGGGGGSAGPVGRAGPAGRSDPISEAWMRDGIEAIVEAWRHGSQDGGTSNVYADATSQRSGASPIDGGAGEGGATARPSRGPAEPEPEPLSRRQHPY